MTLLARIVGELSAQPELIKRREYFYRLRDSMTEVRQCFGLGATMGASAQLLAHVLPPGRQRSDGIRSLLNTAKDLLEWDDATKEAALDELNKIETVGPYAGHPKHHLGNAWFKLWHAATADTSKVGELWSQNEAMTQPRDLAYAQGLLKSFTETPNSGRNELARLIRDFRSYHDRPPRLLDIGCGVGNWLAWCVQHCGIYPADCYGTDALPGRIIAAKDLGETVGIPRGNWMCVNGAANPWDMTPDIVILAATTGCFQDAQLDGFLSDVAASGAPHVFETHSIDSVGAWLGRPNSDAFFARVGYKPLRWKWMGAPLTVGEMPSMVTPQKYFMALRCCVYERQP